MKGKAIIPFLLLASLLLGSCTPAATPGQNLGPTGTLADISSSPQATAGTQTGLSFDCQNIRDISVEECQALVALYESTDGDQWEDNSGWLVNETPCTWYGVICQQGHVVDLELYYNELTGSLPPEIGNLTHLKSLCLDSNQLSGSLPAEIGNLTELQVARLGGNQFNSIPAELTNLNNLMFLELWGNQLSGEIPGELGNLARLNELDLSHNQLTGSIPTEFGNLTNLYWLDLSYNQLTGEVPVVLANALIAELRLWGNLLDGTILASEENITTIEYEGVHFEVNSALAESVWREVVTARPPSEGGPGWDVRPEHVRFTVAGHREQNDFEGMRVGTASQPQILIYPTQKFSAMSELARAEIEALQSLLEARPPAPESEIPLLPLINAAQVFHSQVKYVDFQNGSGVRFITHYSQEVVGRLTNKNILYTFQGLTQNGAYYVAAYFPIAADGLSDGPVDEDWEAAQARLAENIRHLDSLSSHEFEPDLDILDSVVQSLVVNTP